VLVRTNVLFPSDDDDDSAASSSSSETVDEERTDNSDESDDNASVQQDDEKEQNVRLRPLDGALTQPVNRPLSVRWIVRRPTYPLDAAQTSRREIAAAMMEDQEAQSLYSRLSWHVTAHNFILLGVFAACSLLLAHVYRRLAQRVAALESQSDFVNTPPNPFIIRSAAALNSGKYQKLEHEEFI